jgi:hypothetical protein
MRRSAASLRGAQAPPAQAATSSVWSAPRSASATAARAASSCDLLSVGGRVSFSKTSLQNCTEFAAHNVMLATAAMPRSPKASSLSEVQVETLRFSAWMFVGKADGFPTFVDIQVTTCCSIA